eukprot:CAMPEP_0197845348 /NCGR_PEP_ID=MMETSP1438-20131217/2292_1 /TAXON_ID=1461541 /ORGANISM="Pterosperma sp., Strain CCMP1384" /LENGTH=375 /DNA_ID=CAMNT_0043456609 /DNA_START=446 /DNA_END=1573 /DNA_ORIENTATION=+
MVTKSLSRRMGFTFSIGVFWLLFIVLQAPSASAREVVNFYHGDKYHYPKKFLIITEESVQAEILYDYFQEHMNTYVSFSKSLQGTMSREAIADPKADGCYRRSWKDCYEKKFRKFFCKDAIGPCPPTGPDATVTSTGTIVYFGKNAARMNPMWEHRNKILSFCQVYNVHVILLWRKNRLRELLWREGLEKFQNHTKYGEPEPLYKSLKQNLTMAYDHDKLSRYLYHSREHAIQVQKYFMLGMGKEKHYRMFWEDLTDPKQAKHQIFEMLRFLNNPEVFHLDPKNLAQPQTFEEIPIKDLVLNMDDVWATIGKTRESMYLDDKSKFKEKHFRYAKPPVHEVGAYKNEKSFREKPMDWQDHVDAWKSIVGQRGMTLE